MVKEAELPSTEQTSSQIQAQPAKPFVGNVALKCPHCKEMLVGRDWEKNLKVCSRCSYHFKLTAYERVELLTDVDSFVELDAGEGFSLRRGPLSEDPYVVYTRKLEREEIQLAIDGLPSLYREIIVLRDIEGFSYQEIATMLSCPAGTVMYRLGRAREKLRRSLEGWQSKAAARAV